MKWEATRSELAKIISVCVSICALIGYIVRISFSYSKLKTELKNNSNDVDLLKSCNDINTKQLTVLSNNVSTLDILVQNNSKKLDDMELKSSKKFDELFNSRNKTNEVLTELNTTIRMLVSNIDKQFENLDNKIEELKRSK